MIHRKILNNYGSFKKQTAMTNSCLGSRGEIQIPGMFLNSVIVTTAELIQVIFKNANYTHTCFLLRRNKKVICISSRKAMQIIFSAKIKTLLGSWEDGSE